MSAKISITTRIFSKTLLFRSLLNNQLAYLLVPLLYVCVCVCVCIFSYSSVSVKLMKIVELLCHV
jgi:hypothetical protein